MLRTALFSIIFTVAGTLFAAKGDAQMRNAPPPFAVAGGQAIFVDFQEARYHIIIDTKTRVAAAESRIVFISDKTGFPIFDLVDEPSDLQLDGEAVTQKLTKVDNATNVRVVMKSVAPGTHILQLKHKLTAGVAFVEGGANVGFFMDDLSERGFLERYLPSNLDYDQFKILFKFEYVGPHQEQEFFTNGKVVSQNPDAWIIEFPNYFNTSAPYFHTAVKGIFKVERWNYQSIDGRALPVTVYGQAPQSAVVKKVLDELEKDYGPFRHPSVTVYHTNFGGGMEYCGATATASSAHVTGHELTHSYFARGMMPAGGNAGWIDEAIASWRDNHYPTLSSPGYGSANMAGHSVYRRATDTDAYSKGAQFIAYLNSQTLKAGGMKKFLNVLLSHWLFKPLTTADFAHELELFAGRPFGDEFKKYIYGTGLEAEPSPNYAPNRMHHKLTREEVRRLVSGGF